MKSIKAEVAARSPNVDKQEKNALPFFDRGAGAEPIGTSDIFYLKLKSSEDIELLEKLAGGLGIKVIKEITHTPRWYILSILGSEFSSSVEANNYFYETGNFEAVDPAFMFNFAPNADDAEFQYQWGMNNTSYPGVDINVIPAWTITMGAGVKVAVVDTPIYSGHTDLNDNIHPTLSYNALLQQSPSASYFTEYNDHGTHVAGIIAAEKNGTGVTGVAYEAEIVRVSHDLGFTSTMASELASGINWAWKSTTNGGAGVDVINCSWGDRDEGHNLHTELHSSLLEEAIVNAMTQGRDGKGCVVVFAAGNSGHLGAIVNYPANFHDNILNVGAINQDSTRWYKSAYGTKLDVVAPGSSIISTIYGGTGYMNGTSMAAPHVSGIAALLLSKYPNLTRADVVNIIQKSAFDINGDENKTDYPSTAHSAEYGYGLVDAYEALVYATLPLQGGTVSGGGTTYIGGHPGTFTSTVAASGGSGPISYQWQMRTNNTNWSDLALAAGETHTHHALINVQTHYFRRKAMSGRATAYSNIITVHVESAGQLLGGSISPSMQTVSLNYTPSRLTNTQSATGGNGTINYKWQSATASSGWSYISGATGLDYQPPVLTGAGTVLVYRRMVTSSSETAYSNTIGLPII